MCVCTHHPGGPVEPAPSLSYLLPAGLLELASPRVSQVTLGEGVAGGSRFSVRIKSSICISTGKKLDRCHVAQVTSRSRRRRRRPGRGETSFGKHTDSLSRDFRLSPVGGEGQGGLIQY